MPNDASTEAAAALLLMNTIDPPPCAPPGTLCSAISVPSANDIINGRGNFANTHIGNVHFREIIASLKMTYLTAEPSVKKQITRHVLGVIRSKDPPGRFLKQNRSTKLYHEVDKDEALRKIAQALREDAPRLKKMYALEGKITRSQWKENEVNANIPRSEDKNDNTHITMKQTSANPSIKTVVRSGLAAAQISIVTPYDLEFTFNYRTFAIARNRKCTNHTTLSDNDRLKSIEYLEHLSVVGASLPTNLTNIFIMVKMCSGSFRYLGSSSAIAKISEHDIVIGRSIGTAGCSAKNVMLVNEVLAHRIDYRDALNANDSKRMSDIQNLIRSRVRSDSNTRFVEKYDDAFLWKVLSFYDSNTLIASLLRHASLCILEPSSTDVIISKEGFTEENLIENYQGNYYFKCLIAECKHLCSDEFTHKGPCMAREIFQHILGRKGRFLQYDSNFSEVFEVPSHIAIDYCLRNLIGSRTIKSVIDSSSKHEKV